MVAHPRFTFHLKESVEIDLEATARPITDPVEKRSVLEVLLARLGYSDRMDAWLEEDEEVFVHPRDPYVRLDIVASKRPVTVMLGGRKVAESTNARFLYETGLPTRYYLPAEDVDMSVLAATDTRTACPYKGEAIYWLATIGEETFEDIVWSYPDPTPESSHIKDLMCFFNERVDAILVDGEETPRPKTKWSKD